VGGGWQLVQVEGGIFGNLGVVLDRSVSLGSLGHKLGLPYPLLLATSACENTRLAKAQRSRFLCKAMRLAAVG
jgi:hypothetical protein